MELHQLRYFVAVAEEKNFTRAAEICYVSQPSLSRQIAKLEKEIGVPLLDRLPKQVALTNAGKRLYDRALIILESVDSAKRLVNSEKESGTGTLSIGVIPTIGPYLLPTFIRNFSGKFPQVDVIVVEEVTTNLLEKCRLGEIDMAIMAEPVDHNEFSVQSIMHDELLLATQNSHRVQQLPQVTMDDLRTEPFILLHDEHCLGSQVIDYCRQDCEYRPVVTCTSSQMSTVVKMIGMGHGISFIPALAASQMGNEGIAYRPLGIDPPSRELVIVSNNRKHKCWTALEAERIIHDIADDLQQSCGSRGV